MTVAPATPELRRLALLRAFKLNMLRRGGENVSPFADRVVTAHADAGRVDLSGLQAEVREHIVQQIAAVRDNQRSQVVLLSGEAGAGKSHVLRHFAQAAVAEKYGYLFVGGSNDWKVEEFQPCLLDWMIQALTAPDPTSDCHPLLDRIRAVGFRAVGQLLENRTALKRCLARRRRGFLGRLFGRRRANYETVEKLTKARDPTVFALLDFGRFTDEVCSRFLAEAGNPVHRYALKVLLTYLFPDDGDGAGLGTRERVLHWFRRKPDDGYWTRRLGVADNLVHRYAVADAIKLLIHLFSPDLSKRLSVDGDECQPLVFLFVFDQAEGRDELFEKIEDWNVFFAHLSELYNTLPNVLVLFTMTLGLRNELHPKMERQFKDRIRKDERFVLRQPTAEEVCELYRARIVKWLENDLFHQGLYAELPDDEQYLPFGAERLLEIGGLRSVRAALESIDVAFHDAMKILTIEPEYDFEFVRNEERKEIERVSEHEYTEGHLDTIAKLIQPLGAELAAEYSGVRLVAVDEEYADAVRTLKLTFSDPAVPSSWICVHIARFGKVYTASIHKCAELLKNKQHARYSVWLTRAREMTASVPKPDQMFKRLLEPETEARLRAAKHLLEQRLAYEESGTWPNALSVIRREIQKSYLGDLFAHARDRVLARKAGGGPDDSTVS